MSSSISPFPTSISHLSNFIEKTDDDEHLQIYSYKFCDNDSTTEIKNCRGLVFNGDTLISKSLGFTQEYNDTQKDIVMNQNIDLKQVKFFSSEEGTFIRLFYANEKWYLSTHRKLNAFNSRWGSDSSLSFGQIFVNNISELGYESLDVFTSVLDNNYTYIFLIRNTTENRIVSNPPSYNKPKVYFIGCLSSSSYPNFQNSEFIFNSPVSFNFPRQQQLSFDSWDEVFSYVFNTDPLNNQGVIGFYGNNHFKILNSTYQLYSKVRGNEPDICFSYLKNRTNNVYSKMMYDLYPEHINSFLKYENLIVKIAKTIHNAYISRFVNKNYTVVPQDEYHIITDCHGWHISDRKNNKVTFSYVVNVLNKDKFSSTLYKIIKRMLSTTEESTVTN
jgi:hypothetical protein